MQGTKTSILVCANIVVRLIPAIMSAVQVSNSHKVTTFVRNKIISRMFIVNWTHLPQSLQCQQIENKNVSENVIGRCHKSSVLSETTSLFAITFFCRDLCGGAVLSEKLRASLAVSNALPDSLSEKHTVGADFHNSFSRLSPGGDAFFCL